jgi:hypothetical protein
MFTLSRERMGLISAILLIALVGRSNTTDYFSSTNMGQPTTTISPQSTRALSPCESFAFALPDSKIEASKIITSDQEIHLASERYEYHSDQLSLHLALTRDTVAHTDLLSHSRLQSITIPGEYRMDILMDIFSAAPLTDQEELTFHDVNAWVGQTNPSNVVTLKINPPGE